VSLVDERRALVVTAAPGAGKTTRVPPALAGQGPVLLLQPRRVAARAIARRIADERGWTVGREVGWQIRGERRTSADTRVIVATEGILTARGLQDPDLSDLRTVVIDEFHERSVHADLGLAFARRAWRRRSDLRLVVMSATIDAGRVAAFLDDSPIVEVPGRLHPLVVVHRPGVSPEQAILDERPRANGAVLVFLPGAPEIRRVAERLAATPGLAAPIFPLHGGLDADAQDAALEPGAGVRIVLATNLAETTVTVPDVTTVVDTGLHKVARYDPARAIDSLDTERIPADSADQRAGRAGRVRAGRVVRLWDSRDRLRPHREPEIARVDLASTVLAVLAAREDPATFAWFEPPPAHAVESALALLGRLGAVDASGALTPEGRDLQRLPLHPRLGRLLVAAGGAPTAARAAALLSERHFVPPRHGATACDLLAAVDGALPPHVAGTARDIRAAFAVVTGRTPVERLDEGAFRRAVFAAYPDRLARRREPAGDRLRLASGTGARLARESGVHDAEYLVAVDVTAGAAGPRAEALVRLATRVEPEWIAPTSSDLVHAIGEDGVVRAVRRDLYDAMTLHEHHVRPDPLEASRLVAEACLRRGPADADRALLARLAFAGTTMAFPDLVQRASAGAERLDDVRLETALPADVRRRLDRDAPATLKLPGGRVVRLDYQPDGRVIVRTRLQDVRGMTETPRLGPKRTPVTFELLAPNGRPVQVTTDLASFWRRAYPELRPALARRYPKHQW